MPAITVFKNEQGKIAGFGDKGGRAYAKFRRAMAGLEIGQTLTFSFKLPRSPVHHRFFFWKLRGLFKRQEFFADEKRLREWMTSGAGYCDLLPGAGGVMTAYAQSLDFDTMDEAEFVELHRQVKDFMWTEHAQQTLWPHLTAEQRYEMVEQWNREFS